MGYVMSAFFRSFLIQSSWNFERMQSLGFFYSIAPAIKTISKNEDDLRKASRRHLEFFNTNPYMAPAIIGAAIRLEEDGASDEEIKGLKAALMGAYGAIGDSLFWGSLRPIAAVAGVAVALKGSIWAPVLFLLIYNLPHVFIRGYGLSEGYKNGTGVVNAIRKLDIPRRVSRIKSGILFLSGLLFSILFSMVPVRGSCYNTLWIFVLLIVSVLGFYRGLGRGVRVETLAVCGVAVSMLLGFFL